MESRLTYVFMSLHPVLQVFVNFKAGPIIFNGTANDGSTQSQGDVMCDWASVLGRVGMEQLQTLNLKIANITVSVLF